MVENHNHNFENLTATHARPYHFVGSGLPNVFLVGIKYRKCKSCGVQSAEIPAVENLMIAIARAVIHKDDLLNGKEIRFLRKRLGKKSSEFAKVVGVTPEQVSRWENHDANGHERSADKLIRVFYCLLSGDTQLKEQLDRHLEEWLISIPGEEPNSKYCARLKNKEDWTAEPVPA